MKKSRSHQFVHKIKTMPPKDRLDRAKTVMRQIQYKADDLLLRLENIEALGACLRPMANGEYSLAAAAANQIVGDLISQGIIALIAVWDRPDWNAVSIPTLVSLLDHEDLPRIVSKDAYENYLALDPVPPFGWLTAPDGKPWSVSEFHLMEAEKRRSRVIDAYPKTLKSALILGEEVRSALKDARNVRTHSIDSPREAGRSEFKPAAFGDVITQTEQPARLIEDLHLLVHGNCLTLARSSNTSAVNEFWSNMTFAWPPCNEPMDAQN
ncbi:MAG: hypothetical protein AAGF71_12430 [Pseudomonadota bacterium]